jgi:hypothetical protein
MVRSTIARVDSVALAATIGGSVVALAGVGATAWGIKQQREAAKELEASRQAHERLLASGARLFEKRSAVYENMVGLLRRSSPELVAAGPLMNIAGEQQLPEPPSLDERRALMVKLRTFGSTEVGDAYDELVNSMDEFHALKWMLSTTSEIPVPERGLERVGGPAQQGARRPREGRTARERRAGLALTHRSQP